ncbi:Hypothetical predicted protein [Podarcis lilfordi]|uniref:Uncharacterized protein n=1 Tax=Podarcis lilfordi TaxID=74358 RepID=A0AA35LBQ5_9SAUR|nr:Hypothetical predicted protein [Podarcis lilfordi]
MGLLLGRGQQTRDILNQKERKGKKFQNKHSGGFPKWSRLLTPRLKLLLESGLHPFQHSLPLLEGWLATFLSVQQFSKEGVPGGCAFVPAPFLFCSRHAFPPSTNCGGLYELRGQDGGEERMLSRGPSSSCCERLSFDYTGSLDLILLNRTPTNSMIVSQWRENCNLHFQLP